MFPADDGHETFDEAAAGMVMSTTAAASVGGGGEKNSVWFRYVVLSIVVFTSTSPEEDVNDHQPLDHANSSDQTTTTEDQVEVVVHVGETDWERVVRIVDERNLMALRRLGGVDRVVLLQRSHFEVKLMSFTGLKKKKERKKPFFFLRYSMVG